MEPPPSFQIVVAATREGGIGWRGAIPWHLPPEMQYFQRVTLGKLDRLLPNGKGDKGDAGEEEEDDDGEEQGQNRPVVIMGRKTYESIPEKRRPLSGRLNVVLTSRTKEERIARSSGVDDEELFDNVRFVRGGLEAALEKLAKMCGSGPAPLVYVIGGATVYDGAVRSRHCRGVYLTVIEDDYECDTYFPPLTNEFVLDRGAQRHSYRGTWYNLLHFRRRPDKTWENPLREARVLGGAQTGDLATLLSAAAASPGGRSQSSPAQHPELQYLNLVRDILENGVRRGDRTGTGTLSVFGRQLRFSLRGGQFPLLTTKRVFWRGVAEELLWFLRGSTDARELSARGVKIWDGNASRAFLDSRGLQHREEGDLGPVYGFQWRHFGATYTDMRGDYAGQGVDQLAEVIRQIKTNPTDRRILMSAWNPCDLDKMALPPCHVLAQFYVDTERGELSCQMYQRSADVGLGVPFNIASYALLTCMVASVCGLKPGEFVHTLGDAHVYLNHVQALCEQVERAPMPFPQLRVNPRVADIDAFTLEDLELENYRSHGKLAMEMAV